VSSASAGHGPLKRNALSRGSKSVKNPATETGSLAAPKAEGVCSRGSAAAMIVAETCPKSTDSSV
jgi:hypothetical protein